eukprot:m.141592 g.141592  ORF g.141592 m.141592 type:complete len:461 (+) comp38348_c1_seq13:61-1443(+)
MAIPNYNSDSRVAGVIVVLAGILVHLTLGTFYTFGNMSPYIVSYIRKYGHPSSINPETLIWIYALTGAGQGGAMYLGGRIEKKLGPRLTTLLGSCLVSLGIALSYFTISSFWLLFLTYGLLFGVGIGISYPVPMACAMTWWPEKKGLIAGLVVSGFGAGATIFDQVQTQFINPQKLNPTIPDPDNPDQKYFGNESLLRRTKVCFLLLGGTYFAAQLIGCFFLVNRKTAADGNDSMLLQKHEHEEEDDNIDVIGGNITKVTEEKPKPPSLTPFQSLKTKRFYMLWVMFFCLGQAVTFVASLYKAYGLTYINDDAFMAIVGSIASPFNALGRILWGFLADRFSFRIVVLSMASIFTALIFSFHLAAIGGKPVFALWVCLLFFCIGGPYALFPAATVQAFGQSHFASIYGLVFTSQIFSAFAGAFLATTLSKTIGYSGIWFLSGAITYIAVVVAYFYKDEKKS